MARPFFTPIAAAVIIAFMAYPVFAGIQRMTGRPIVSATLVIVGIVLFVIIPVSMIGGVMLSQVNKLDFNEERLSELEAQVESLTGQEVTLTEYFVTIENYVKSEFRNWLPKVVSITSNFLIGLGIMFFILFYLLLQKDMFIRETIRLLPFSKKGSTKLLTESGHIVRAVLIGQVLTALIQGALGMFSFIVVGVEGAFLWGVLMVVLSLIPVVGAFLVWIPVGAFLLLDGLVWQAIFVFAWGGLIVSQVDNFVRPKLVNQFYNIHPLETFIGIFIGIAQFGMLGIILGPFMVSLFKVLITIFREDYLPEKE
jgi:predicted PurR-regulated permease PerM